MAGAVASSQLTLSRGLVLPLLTSLIQTLIWSQKNTASPHQLHMRSIGHNVPHTDGHRDLAMVSSVTQRHVVVTVVTFRIQSLVS